MSEEDVSIRPLFIVGSPRSGTSILVRALLGAGYLGYNEGNFLSLVRVIERDVDRHFQTFGTQSPQVLISKIDKEALKEKLARVVAEQVDRLHDGEVWLDKTGNPEMIEAIPTLRRIWPTSHFIFAKRRALENLVSRIRKFPGHTFDYHCHDWARNMAAWSAFRLRYPDAPVLEIDQHDISVSATATAAKIGNFLQMSEAAKARMSAIFGNERPQQTEPGSADRVVSLSGIGWTEAQIHTFHERCDEQMRAYGYSEDESYRLSV